MILFNKLIRTDLMLLVAALLMLVAQGGFWRGFLEGFVVAVLILSVGNHMEHYKRTKKLY